MPRRQLKVTSVVVASVIALIHATMVHAQEARRSVTAGVAISTQYPDRFKEGCGNPAAVAPSVRVYHRIYGIITAELGISGSIQMPPGSYCSTGDALPLEDGDIVRHFDTTRGSLSVSGEARVVLTPMSNGDGAVRLIAGGAWYPARKSPAWVVGAGYRPLNWWGALVFDVEYWSVGVAYDLERFRLDAPREFLGDGREWQGFLQLRAGITLWSN